MVLVLCGDAFRGRRGFWLAGDVSIRSERRFDMQSVAIEMVTKSRAVHKSTALSVGLNWWRETER